MNKKTFEEYLQDRFSIEYPELVSDDDGPDRFEAWLERLDTEEVINYAEQAVNELLESYDRLAKLAEKLEIVNEQAIRELKHIGTLTQDPALSEREAYELDHVK